ncbi:MAG TPA: hypothetical protein VIG55_05430 [Methylosinus sp.]|jgi:hypothetical protein
MLTINNHPNSIANRLLRLWSDKDLETAIREKINQRKSSPIFLHAYKSMLSGTSENFGAWREKHSGGFNEYKLNVERPLPIALFGPTHIKNSAVHAKSDRYREGDLINQNSHSNQTEKMHYLTDANKDWINQNGRITRAVLYDIERYVYRPNLNAAIQQAHENLIRTRVISVLDAGIDGTNEVRINPLGCIDFGDIETEGTLIDADSIVVLDTPETVINMLHYISEAERQKDILIANSLSFFERTVLPTVEWMDTVMSKMSTASVKQGECTYENVKGILPPLFLNELCAGITA